MGDRYPPRDYRRGEGRYGGDPYAEGEYDPYYGAPPPQPRAPPRDPGYDRRYPEYEGGYEGARPGVPREYARAPPPIRADEYPPRPREGRDYAPPPGRADPYMDPGYYPERGYRAPGAREPRDPYGEGRGYPPPETYPRDDSRYRRRDDEFEPRRGYPPREYPSGYPPYEDPAPPSSRRPPPAEYARPPYEEDREPPVRMRRIIREQPVNIPPTEPDDPYYEFELPAEGIRKEVLQRELTLFLGGDATMRGPMIREEDGMPVYKYQAYRQLTREQIKDLKKRSARLEGGGYSRGLRDEPPASSRRSRNTEEDSPMGGDPNVMDERPEYTYVSSADTQGMRAPMRSGRMPMEPPQYGAPYEGEQRRRRPPMEAPPPMDDEMSE